MKTKIKLVLGGVHMGLGHTGLAEIAKKHGYDPTPPRNMDGNKKAEWMAEHRSHLLIFINSAQDKLKILSGAGDVFGYLKPHHGQKIALDAIQYIPQTFGSKGFDYEAALNVALEQRLLRGKAKATGPLAIYRAKERAGLTAKTANN